MMIIKLQGLQDTVLIYLKSLLTIQTKELYGTKQGEFIFQTRDKNVTEVCHTSTIITFLLYKELSCTMSMTKMQYNFT